MTIQKLIDKYMGLQRQGFETITLAQVLSDLYGLKLDNLRPKK